jgi:hypothetical protein
MLKALSLFDCTAVRHVNADFGILVAYREAAALAGLWVVGNDATRVGMGFLARGRLVDVPAASLIIAGLVLGRLCLPLCWIVLFLY